MLKALTPIKLAEICGGIWHPTVPNGHASGINIDSRAVQTGDLFVALKGRQSDGHDFVAQLNAGQVFAAIVNHAVARAEIPQLVVPDTLVALHTLAQAFAKTTTATKLAITGSVGKTGTKEMLANLLASAGKTHATGGNYNNHIGMPLTLAAMPKDTQYLAVEMGMNHAGEIAVLTEITLPHIAAITCISDAHSEHFSSLSDIAEAKTEIFIGLSGPAIAILPRDDSFFGQLAGAARLAGARTILTFGYHEESDIRIVTCDEAPQGLSLCIGIPDADKGRKTLSFSLGMRAAHWAVGAACALAMALAAGIDVEHAVPHLASLKDLPGRGLATALEIAGHSFTLIDDSYNASPSSMVASLAHLATRPDAVKTAILSDMLELGEGSHEAHLSLAGPVINAGITRLVTIGAMMADHLGARLASDIEVISFASAEELCAELVSHPAQMLGTSSVVLVKGSHGSGAHSVATTLTALGAQPSYSVVAASLEEGITPYAA